MGSQHKRPGLVRGSSSSSAVPRQDPSAGHHQWTPFERHGGGDQVTDAVDATDVNGRVGKAAPTAAAAGVRQRRPGDRRGGAPHIFPGLVHALCHALPEVAANLTGHGRRGVNTESFAICATIVSPRCVIAAAIAASCDLSPATRFFLGAFQYQLAIIGPMPLPDLPGPEHEAIQRRLTRWIFDRLRGAGLRAVLQADGELIWD